MKYRLITEKSVECMRKALALAKKDNKDNVQSISFDLGQGLYVLKRYDEADAVYRQMIKDDETDQAALTGLARNMIARGEYQKAVDILDGCVNAAESGQGCS